MRPYDYDEALKIFLDECEKSGVSVQDGTGRITMDGEDFDIAEALLKTFDKRVSCSYTNNLDVAKVNYDQAADRTSLRLALFAA